VTEFRRRNHGGGHSYYLGDRKLDGVTSIISGGLPKPALVKWAANCAAEKAVNEWDQLAELPVAERLKLIARAPNDKRDAAAVKGTRIHAIADKLSRDEAVKYPDELAGHVESCVKWLDEWNPKVIAAEAPVYHEKYLYAGTLDLLAEVDEGDGPEVELIDFKTSASGAYGDTALQLSAYGFATHILLPDGLRPMIRPVKYRVVWLRADGYSFYPYHVDETVFRQFLYVQQVARAAEDCKSYKGDELTAPVIA